MLLLLTMASLFKNVFACASTASAGSPITTSTESPTTTTADGSVSTTTTTTTTTTSTTTTTTTTTPTCPDGWTQFEQSCYQFPNVVADFNTALMSCRALGADMVSIHSQAENDFINNFVLMQEIWIGAIRTCPTPLSDACIINVDGSPLDYTNWLAGDPNNAGGAEFCIEMNSANTGQWNDRACTSQLFYACEMPLG